MGPYNGFDGALRAKAQRWLNAEWAAGRLARPTVCCACGQDQGTIDAHAEDYSEPFRAGKTDEFHLCFTCHMMVHCREKNPDAWRRYRYFVEAGGRGRPYAGRPFPAFQATYLRGKIPPSIFTRHAPPTQSVLAIIELSQDKHRNRRAYTSPLMEAVLKKLDFPV